MHAGWFDMRHVMTATLMFGAALLLTATAATLIQRWAMAQHVAHDLPLPPPVPSIAEQRTRPVDAGRSPVEDCAPSGFQLGSPYRIKKITKP